MGIDGIGNNGGVQPGSNRIRMASPAQAQAGMDGDSLSLSRSGESPLVAEAKSLTPEQASTRVKWGFGMAVAGSIAAWIGVHTAGGLVAAFGTMAWPLLLVGGGLALAAFGAKWLVTGLGAQVNQQMESYNKRTGLDDILNGR